jgi:hypothetical protein
MCLSWRRHLVAGSDPCRRALRRGWTRIKRRPDRDRHGVLRPASTGSDAISAPTAWSVEGPCWTTPSNGWRSTARRWSR